MAPVKVHQPKNTFKKLFQIHYIHTKLLNKLNCRKNTKMKARPKRHVVAVVVKNHTKEVETDI